jgi:hypothetical protein
VSGTSWGGHTGEKLWLNVFQWFWAIAESGSPADVDPAWLAGILGMSSEEAARVVARAERYFCSMRRSNQRTGAFQQLGRCTRNDLRAMANRRGLKTTGWELKAELVARLVDVEYPAIGERGNAH